MRQEVSSSAQTPLFLNLSLLPAPLAGASCWVVSFYSLPLIKRCRSDFKRRKRASELRQCNINANAHTHGQEGVERGEETGGPRRQLIACLLCHSLVATAATATATDALPRRQHKIFRLAVIIMKGRRSFRAVAVAVAVKLKLNLLRARNFIKILLARYVCGLRTC